MTPSRRIADVVTVVLFALALIVPITEFALARGRPDSDFITANEHRNPAALPPFTPSGLLHATYEHQLEPAISDAFPFRGYLVEGYRLLTFAWLHDISTYQVIGGSDGWLYYGDEEHDYLNGTFNPSQADLEYLVDIHRTRALWCKQHGIRYLAMFIPNKSTVYPQYLPPDLRPQSPSPLARLVPLLRAAGVETLDLRDAMQAGAVHDHVFSKGDAHWSEVGAYIGYRALTGALRTADVRETIAPATVRRSNIQVVGDLYAYLGLGTMIPDDIVHIDYPHRAREIDAPEYASDPDLANFERHVTVVDDPTLPKGVLFGDSFTMRLRPFLAESFRRLVVLRTVIFAQQRYNTHIIMAEHPRVVIDEVIERSLFYEAQYLQ